MIEDVAHAQKNYHDHDNHNIADEEEEDGALPTTTLSDISQQLDQAILDGYQSTFTVAEFDEWMQTVAMLYTYFQSKLANNSNNRQLLSPDASEESTMTKVVDQLETRLEQLQTLIAPRSTVIPRIPIVMATLTHQSTLSSTEETKLGQPEAATSSDSTTSKEPSTVKAITTTTASTKEEGAFFMDVLLKDESPSESESESEESGKNSTTSDEGFDAVTAVMSVAAIGAVAVTKGPFFAAGLPMPKTR